MKLLNCKFILMHNAYFADKPVHIRITKQLVRTLCFVVLGDIVNLRTYLCS